MMPLKEHSLFKYKVSIITPTYNRANKISRVFNSLIKQTYTNFEWIVIDDGSTDNTEEVIKDFQKKNPFFPIIYSYKENMGVPYALSHAIEFITGDFVIKCDSDDEYVPHMIEKFLSVWEMIPQNDKPFFRAIGARVINQKGLTIGKDLPHEYIDGYPLEIEFKYHRRQEQIWLERADLFSQFSFLKDYPDHFIWYKFIRRYKVRCINEPLRIYYQSESDSLTLENSPRRFLMRFRAATLTLSYEMDYFFYDPLVFYWRASNIWLYGRKLKMALSEIFTHIHSFSGRILFLFSIPLATIRSVLLHFKNK